MRKVVRKNGKAFEGLTSRGLAQQIASALCCFHDEKCSPNDCQHTINPLVRAYHNTIIKERSIALPETPLATKAKANRQRVIREHAIPAHEVVCRLMDIDPVDQDFIMQVIATLEETFNVALVVQDEHNRLNSKHMHSLPVMPGATFQELAALRYRQCEVDLPIRVENPDMGADNSPRLA